jgi:hypothetical protein
MTYGHDRIHPNSAYHRGQRAGGWRDLDPDNRLALIERALNGPRQAAA